MRTNQQDTDTLLSARTDDLLWEYRRTLTHREVIHAVARARMEVRDGYRSMALELPAADEYVSLVIGMARRHLRERFVVPPQETGEDAGDNDPTCPSRVAG